jgi:hypothetical protein
MSKQVGDSFCSGWIDGRTNIIVHHAELITSNVSETLHKHTRWIVIVDDNSASSFAESSQQRVLYDERIV